MCLVFIIYYPRMKTTRNCLSGLTPQTVMTLSDVAEVRKYWLFVYLLIISNTLNPMSVLMTTIWTQRLSFRPIMWTKDFHIMCKTSHFGTRKSWVPHRNWSDLRHKRLSAIGGSPKGSTKSKNSLNTRKLLPNISRR